MEDLNFLETVKYRLSSDVTSWREVVPGLIYPFRAIALARVLTNISAAQIAEIAGISRSYLAALENYGKPLPSNTDTILEKIFAHRDGIDNFQDVLSILINPEDINRNVEYFLFLQEKISELEPRLLVLLFEILTSLKDRFEILYYDINSDFQNTYDNMISAGLIPEWWPLNKIPKMIIAEQKSGLPAFLFNLVSAEQVASCYKIIAYQQPFTPVVFMDRMNLFRRKNISLYSISGISAFFLKEIRVSIKSSAIFPLDVDVFFKDKWYEFNTFHRLHYFFNDLCRGNINETMLEEFKTDIEKNKPNKQGKSKDIFENNKFKPKARAPRGTKEELEKEFERLEQLMRNQEFTPLRKPREVLTDREAKQIKEKE